MLLFGDYILKTTLFQVIENLNVGWGKLGGKITLNIAFQGIEFDI